MCLNKVFDYICPQFKKKNNMKKILLIVLAVVTAGEIFYGCKKGNEDPLLSFRSRKHRVTGLWQVCSYRINDADSLIDNISKFDTASIPYGCLGKMTYTRKKTYIMEFDDNGLYIFRNTFLWTVSRDWNVNTPQCTDSTEYIWKDTTYLTKGLWTLAGGVGDYKNKELLQLTDGVDQVTGQSYELIEVREKELKFRQSVTDQLTGVVTKWEWTLCPYADSTGSNGNQ